MGTGTYDYRQTRKEVGKTCVRGIRDFTQQRFHGLKNCQSTGSPV